MTHLDDPVVQLRLPTSCAQWLIQGLDRSDHTECSPFSCRP